MDLNYILTWVVLISCGMLVFRFIRQPLQQRGWLWITVGIPVAMGVTALLMPGKAGFIGGLLWGGLLILPSLGSGYVAKASLRQNFAQAARLAKILRVLHPLDGWWEMPDVYHALALAREGQFDRAEAILTRLQAQHSQLGRMATLQILRMRGRWDELLAWLHAHQLDPEYDNDVAVVTYQLRALGETGDLNRMVDLYRRKMQLIEANGLSVLTQCRLFLFAYTGKSEAVEQLLTLLPDIPAEAQDLWRITAEMAAGVADTRMQLAELLLTDDALLRIAVEHRLESPPIIADDVLTPENQAEVAAAMRAMEEEERYRSQPKVVARAYATYAVIAVNLLVFARELWLRGSTSETVLVDMGALVPFFVLQGEWWRLIAAAFLHYGWLHLTLNMLALLIFGRMVEYRLGSGRFLVTYLASGVLGMLLITLLTPNSLQISVGASGCIMGLVGAYGAIALQGWRRDKSAIARRQLHMVVTIVLLQAVFDFLTPQVSFVGHLSGAILGFLTATLLLTTLRWPVRPHLQPVRSS